MPILGEGDLGPLWGEWATEQGHGDGQQGMDVGGCQEAVVTYFHKSLGQDVLEEPGDEDPDIQGGGGPVPRGKGDRLVGDLADAVIGDGYPVGVSAQVAEDLLGAEERRLDVDHPGFVEQGAAQLIEGIGLGWLVAEQDLSLDVEACEAMEKLSPEQSGKDRDGKQELPRGRCPALNIRVQTAAGNDAMQVGMVAKVPVGPCVQYGGEPEQGPESFGVPAKLEQRPGGGLEEQVVDPARISLGQAVKFARQGEDHMEVVGRQDTPFTLLEPPGLVQGLAFGAMPIAA